MSEADGPMLNDLVEHSETTISRISVWQPVSITSAMPYLKALGLVTTLLGMWASLCAI